MQLEAYRYMVNENVIHLKTNSGKYTNYLCAWYIRNCSSVWTCRKSGFIEPNKSNCYLIELNIKEENAFVHITCYNKLLSVNISISTQSGKILLKNNDLFLPIWPVKNSSDKYLFSYSASVEGEDLQKLKTLPDNSCAIICQMKRYNTVDRIEENIDCSTSENNSNYLKSLKVRLNNNSGTSSEEKVTIRVGEETEVVNKAVLCLQSPVFAKIFGNDMKELKEDTVTIIDIKMPVLKTLVSFLYSGVLPDCDFDFLCELYYAADKYYIPELQQACVRLFLSKVSHENIFRILKLSFRHNDELLKSAVMTLISANIKTIVFTSDWKNLMQDNPEMALEASTFF